MAYGFEIRDGSNVVVVDSTDATLRIVHREYIPYGFSGTRSVPNFNSDNGTFYYRAHLTPVILNEPDFYSVNTVYDSASDVDYSFPSRSASIPYFAGYMGYTGSNFSGLSISFDNVSKLLTISGTYIQTWNGGTWGTTGNFEVIFMEYK